jgi:hypothetical protein
MKPSEKRLERLVKQMVRGQETPVPELLSHWEGLGSAGDRVILRVLNRQNAWEPFLSRVMVFPELKSAVERLADASGVPTSADDLLSRYGLSSSEADSPKCKAQWIAQAVGAERRNDWGRARTMMLRDTEILDGVLMLLEELPDAAVAAFLMELPEEDLSRSQRHAVRKLLYRLRQKGVDITDGRPGMSEPELFAFTENRLPLWQMAFYFRTHSPYGSSGDLYILRYMEGQDFEQPDQERDVSLDRAAMGDVAADYSRRLQEQIGIQIPFRHVSPTDARHWLRRTLTTLEGNEAARARISAFLRFVGGPAGQEPEVAESSNSNTLVYPGPDRTAVLLQAPYFRLWFLDAEKLQGFFEEVRKMQEGPIVLTEYQQRERRTAAGLEALRGYFDRHNRMLWALAFDKAAFFLEEENPDSARDCRAIARAFTDTSRDIESIPAAALLFDRTATVVDQQNKAKEKEEKRGSLIISPEEFARQQERKKQE